MSQRSSLADHFIQQMRADLKAKKKRAEHKPTPITEDMAEYQAAHRTEESDHA